MGLLPSEKFREAVCNARVVISHCGEGNLLLLQELGTPFVLVPRTKQRKEHVDDHQLELAQVLEKAGLPVAFDESGLLKMPSESSFCQIRIPRRKNCRSAHAAQPQRRSRAAGYFQWWSLSIDANTGAHTGSHSRIVSGLHLRTKQRGTMLENEAVVWAHSPTNRNIPNLIRNNLLAYRTIRSYRPDIILSTGAGVSVPFLLQGKLMG